MSLTLTNIRKKEVPFTCEIEEGVIIEGTCNPRSYTVERLNELSTLDGSPESWVTLLVGDKPSNALLMSLDIVWSEADAEDGLCSKEDVGKHVPITRENLTRLFPLEILALIAKAARETIRPNSMNESENRADNTSSLTDEEGPLLSNTDS
jgi:hypothetical protein